MSFSAYHSLSDHPVLGVSFVAATLVLVGLTRNTRKSGATKTQPQAPQPVPSPVPTKPVYRTADHDTPWVSEIFTGANALCAYEPASQSEPLLREESKRRGAANARNMAGLELGPEWFFKQTWAMEEPPNKLTDIAVINGQFLLVSPEMRSIFEQASVGQSNFYDTEFFAADGVTSLPHRHTYWNIGNSKDTLIIEKSTELAPITKDETSSLFGVFHKPKRVRDGMLCLSEDCLGGADIWIEARMRGVIFFSDSLVRKLDERGFAELFELSRCKLDRSA